MESEAERSPLLCQRHRFVRSLVGLHYRVRFLPPQVVVVLVVSIGSWHRLVLTSPGCGEVGFEANYCTIPVWSQKTRGQIDVEVPQLSVLQMSGPNNLVCFYLCDRSSPRFACSRESVGPLSLAHRSISQARGKPCTHHLLGNAYPFARDRHHKVTAINRVQLLKVHVPLGTNEHENFLWQLIGASVFACTFGLTRSSYNGIGGARGIAVVPLPRTTGQLRPKLPSSGDPAKVTCVLVPVIQRNVTQLKKQI